MSKWFFVVVCVVAALSAEVQSARLKPRQNTTCTIITSANTPSTSDANALLDLHNFYRASDANASGKSIPNLVWDNDLAALGQGWSDNLASRAAFEHGNYDLCNGTSLGQNIYYGGNSDKSNLVPTAAVNLWNSEKVNYNYENNTCAAKKVCGHYTQNVWAATQRLGCGISYYFASGMYKILVVCNYYPPGNFNKQRPY